MYQEKCFNELRDFIKFEYNVNNKNMNAIAFQIKLDSDTIHLDNVNNFIGKDVMITIVEMPAQIDGLQSKDWKFLGSATLSKNTDQLNIRDIAYE